MFSSTAPGKKIADVMRSKANARLKPLRLTTIAIFSGPNLEMIGTEQVHQTSRALLGDATYVEKNPRMCAFYYTLFRAGKSPVVLVIGGQCQQNILNYSRHGAIATFDITIPSVLEFQMFLNRTGIKGKTI